MILRFFSHENTFLMEICEFKKRIFIVPTITEQEPQFKNVEWNGDRSIEGRSC